MRVSHRWLAELVPGLDAPPSEVGERLTRAGLEVESYERFGEGLDAVVIAEVITIEPHPSRDKLRLVTVNHGSRQEQVVCGAPNVPAAGGRVLFARVGTRLPALGVTLEPRVIGGVPSEGMLVSERELGLSEESDGIVVLEPADGEIGGRLSGADTIFEIGVTPNRPDALGHVGVARDLAALFRLEVRPPDAGTAREADDTIESLVSVANEDVERCPFYGVGAVLDCDVAPSPAWLRWRLGSLGVRPISNVVDATNLVLLEWGQPLHAFDLDLVRGGRIVVRRAGASEIIETLDGVKRTLVADDLVIGDGEGPTALAGVMGGASSEIRTTTRRVLLESAFFEPRGVRRTSRRHGLSTESSYRFERGVDPAVAPRALERARALIARLAGGAVARGTIAARGAAPERKVVALRSSRLDALLGTRVPFGEASDCLARLGFAIEEGDGGAATFGVPSWRRDVSREVDLIEEVARVRGLDSISPALPRTIPQRPRRTGALERDAARIAVELGLDEALPYSFVGPESLAAVHAPPPVVRLTNPLSDARTVMRTSLLPGLLEALQRARRHGEASVRLFSVGALFLATDGSSSDARPSLPGDRGVLPLERPALSVVLSGPRPTHLAAPESVDLYDAKGVALEIVGRLTGRRASVVRAIDRPELHPRGAANVVVDGVCVGRFGPLHPDVQDHFEIDESVVVVEMDLGALEVLSGTAPRYRPIPRLPALTRDLAFAVPDEVAAGDVESAILTAAGELCEAVLLFDLYRGANVGDGSKSLAFHLVYRDPRSATDSDQARTLTDREVDECQERVSRAVRERFGAVLRS